LRSGGELERQAFNVLELLRKHSHWASCLIAFLYRGYLSM
jgi:hypothetical protein